MNPHDARIKFRMLINRLDKVIRWYEEGLIDAQAFHDQVRDAMQKTGEWIH